MYKILNLSHVVTDPFSDPLWHFITFRIQAIRGRGESNSRPLSKKTPENANSHTCAAQCAARSAQHATSRLSVTDRARAYDRVPPQQLIDAWAKLPDAIRKGIIAMAPATME